MGASIESPHFLYRRFHSLLGLVPVGAFLAFHLWENSQSRRGVEAYNEVVASIQSLNYVLFFEIFVIALPLLFHAVYGLVIAQKSKGNTQRFPFLRNWMWWFQRLSGYAILAFLLVHVTTTRLTAAFAPESHLIHRDIYAYMQDHLSNPLMFLVYLLGMMLAAVHLGNGLFTAAITWGLTTTPRSQRISSVVCGTLAVLLIALGIHSLVGFFLFETTGGF